MKNKMLMGISAGIFLLGFSTSAFPAGDATVCVVTIKKVELKNSAGEWVTLIDTEQPLDLLNTEAAIILQNDGKIPEGTYENVRLTLSETFTVAGFDGANHTKAGGHIVLGGTASKAFELPGEIKSVQEKSETVSGSEEGNMTVQINFDHEDRDDVIEIFGKRSFSKLLTIKKTSKIKVLMGLQLKTTVNFAWKDSLGPGVPTQEIMYFIPPDKVDEIVVRSDASTGYLSSDMIEMAF